MITIICQRTSRHYQVPQGSTLRDVERVIGHTSAYPTLAAYVNNRIREMHFRIYEPSTIEFIDISSYSGLRVYQRTISLILQRAAEEVFPNNQLYVRHSLGLGGLYCELEGVSTLSSEELTPLYEKMREIVDANTPIVSSRVVTSQACELYAQRGYYDKVQLLKTRPRLYAQIYHLDDSVGYFYGVLAASTSDVPIFAIEPCYKGFALLLPSRENPGQVARACSDNMFEVFDEYQRWVDIMKLPTVGSLNERVLAGDSNELIRIAEALHERLLSDMADAIVDASKSRGSRLVLLSGPSSSGKTTTSKRLGVHLKVLGFTPVLISMDDYFVNRDQTPLDKHGNYDFESLGAVDVEQFNIDIKRLFSGESVDIPRYDFISGKRQWHEHPLTLSDDAILIVEGIHALNPLLTPHIEESLKFKIYASCITTMSMDSINRISTTDNRLLRRLIRDYRTRGCSAQTTLSRWASVRRGEERHIFPYQKYADLVFNTSLLYEISVLRSHLEPILREVNDTEREYDNARRLLKFLDNFTPIDPKEIPSTSLLREFIGGSGFSY